MLLFMKAPWSPAFARVSHSSRASSKMAFGSGQVTARISRSTFSGWSMASHWAIMPPMLTPNTSARRISSTSMAWARSRAMERMVYPDGMGSMRLKEYTVNFRANSRYRIAMGTAAPLTERRLSPRPGSMMSTRPPLPKRI